MEERMDYRLRMGATALMAFAVLAAYYWYAHVAHISQNIMLTLTSPSFQNGMPIPERYTCDGQRLISPPLLISNPPEGTKSFALVMDDPDVPKELLPSGVFDHWVLYNIPSSTTEIREGTQDIGMPGMNGRNDVSYTGPCPPPEHEPSQHRYFFRLYALSGTINFIKAPTKDELVQAIQGQILEQAELMGTYERPKNP